MPRRMHSSPCVPLLSVVDSMLLLTDAFVDDLVGKVADLWY